MTPSREHELRHEYRVVFDGDPDQHTVPFTRRETAEKVAATHTTRKAEIQSRVVCPWSAAD